MPTIPSLSGSYIDQTYQRLVQVSGSNYADGLGNPISFGPGTLSGGTDGYIPLWSGSNALTSSYITQVGSILRTTSSYGTGNGAGYPGFYIDFNNQQYILGDVLGSVANGVVISGGSGQASLQGSLAGNNLLFELNASTNAVQINNGAGNGLQLDFTNKNYILGDYANSNNSTKIIINDNTSTVSISGSLSLNGVTGDLRPYKVYTALLTQAGSGAGSFIDNVPLIIGATYTISVGFNPGDFTNVGAPNNDNATSFVATGTTPTSWGDSQLGYSAATPVVTVLENTIGNIWFTYIQPGRYSVKSDGLFLGSKTFCTIGNVIDLDGYAALAGLTYQGDVNTVQIETTPFQTGTNGLLSNTPMEIRVYN